LTEGEIGVLSVCSLFLRRVGVYVGVCVSDRGVVSVFSIFKAGGSVCGCMCEYTHAHTHTAQMGYSVVSPGVGMRHLEGLKNPDRLNLSICIFVYMYKVHICHIMYILGGRMGSWTICFFFKTFFLSKNKSKRCERKPPIISNPK